MDTVFCFHPLAGKWLKKATREGNGLIDTVFCFHPLAGKWLKKLPEDEVMRRRVAFVSIPLRGNDWKRRNPPSPPPLRRWRLVSIPLRGNDWKRYAFKPFSRWSHQFPSPCGEMIEKDGFYPYSRTDPAFPSPCGEMIEKVGRFLPRKDVRAGCFHPLAGKWLKKSAISTTTLSNFLS